MLDKKFSGGLTYQGAVNTLGYLLNERVDKGTAKILDGDEGITTELIQLACSKFKSGWSSGVLSFEETISEVIAKEIIAEHKRITFCGMNENQFNSLYILHTDKDRTELHYIFPKIELSTGKMLNPYYVKRDFIKKDLFQDYINAKFNLSSPKYKDKREFVTRNKKKWATAKSNIQKEVDEAIKNLMDAGLIESRNDIIDFLRENGFEINCLRKTSITFLHESVKNKDGTLMPIPLKGKEYGEDFTDWASLNRSIEKEDKEARRGSAELKGELDKRVRAQTIYNRERYKPREGSEQGEQNTPRSDIRRDGLRSEIKKSEGEDNVKVSNEHKEKLTREAERRVVYDRYRAIAERSRRESKQRREKTDRERREALAGLEGVADEFHRERSGEASGTTDQQNLTDRIGEYFAINPDGSRERAVSYIGEIEKLDADLTETISIEAETERIIEDYEHKLGQSSKGIGRWLGEQIKSITEQIGELGETIGQFIDRWIENAPTRDAKARNAKGKDEIIIKSVLDDKKIVQGISPKFKR